MKKIAIIGGGLAGTACAYFLKKEGFYPVIYEAGPTLASGASGNEAGLYNPRLSAEKNSESEYFTAAFKGANKIFPQLKNIDWNPCGSLHLVNSDKKEKIFAQTLKNWEWPVHSMRLLNAWEASAIANIPLNYKALYLPQSGTVSPAKLCAAYAEEVEIKCGVYVKNLQELEEEYVILAGGFEIKNFPEFSNLPLRSVRGQITKAKATSFSENLKCNLCYGGYIMPTQNECHMIGATFQRWLNHSDILEDDDARNLAQLAGNIPMLKGFEITGHRAALRTTTPDHFPIVGQVSNNLYISTAHGSHGILSSLAAAHLIVDLIKYNTPAFSPDLIRKLSPFRFSQKL